MNTNDRKARRSPMKSAILALASLAAMVALSSCASTKEKEELPPLSENEMKILKMIGGSLDANGDILLDRITIHRREREISFPAHINIREGQIEVLISTATGRVHESLLIAPVDPFKLQLALILLGAKNGPATDKAEIPMGDLFDIEVSVTGGNRQRIDSWLFNSTKGRLKLDEGYVFVGSNFSADNKCLASVEGNLVNINSMDDNTILNAKAGDDAQNDILQCASEKIPKSPSMDKDNPKPEDLYLPVEVFIHGRKAAASK